jgi:hypothetical protein
LPVRGGGGERLRGERHAVGPVKRFAVDLAHELADRGHDVGLYVEGFRTDCLRADAACDSLARLFNAEAFRRLLDESRVPVHAIDPPEEDRRAARMAAAIAAGPETIRIVLVGAAETSRSTGDRGGRGRRLRDALRSGRGEDFPAFPLGARPQGTGHSPRAIWARKESAISAVKAA